MAHCGVINRHGELSPAATCFPRPDGSVKSIRPQHLEHTADVLKPLEPRSWRRAPGGFRVVMGWWLWGSYGVVNDHSWWFIASHAWHLLLVLVVAGGQLLSSLVMKNNGEQVCASKNEGCGSKTIEDQPRDVGVIVELVEKNVDVQGRRGQLIITNNAPEILSPKLQLGVVQAWPFLSHAAGPPGVDSV